MQTVVDLELPVPPDQVWPHVVELGSYPDWMRLVHAVEPADRDDDGPDAPVWNVELRARIGPLARSKRLRMVRTGATAHERVRFERREHDGREHADWILTATLAPVAAGTLLTMDLYYGGRLWTAGVIDQVLEQEIRRGKTALLARVTGSSPAR